MSQILVEPSFFCSRTPLFFQLPSQHDDKAQSKTESGFFPPLPKAMDAKNDRFYDQRARVSSKRIYQDGKRRTDRDLSTPLQL